MSLHAFNKFENDSIVFKGKTAFVCDDFISGLIPFNNDDPVRDGEVSRPTILTFLNITSGNLQFSTDRRNEKLIMKTESGAIFKTPFKVIAEHIDFPKESDPIQTITMDWDEFSKVLNLGCNISKMGTKTAFNETLGVVFEGNNAYSTDTSTCFIYNNMTLSEPFKSRVVLLKNNIKIILEWMKAFGDPSTFNIHTKTVSTIEWTNGAILHINCPLILKPIPFDKLVKKGEEQHKVGFSKELKNVILEISKLDDKLEIDGKFITSSKSNSYSYKHEMKEPLSDAKYAILNLQELNRFAELTDYISSPIADTVTTVSADGKIMYMLSPLLIKMEAKNDERA